VREEELEPFAVADGLIARMAAQPPGQVTSEERRWMLDHARECLADVAGMTLDEAGRALTAAAHTGDLTEQYSRHLAVVTYHGRILYVLGRVALRGVCHPDLN
jgi:hypothetical protein